jgi:cyclase
MSSLRVIPCLDIADGRVVKGTRFLDLKDSGDPIELARRYGEDGADELVFLDITASHEDRSTVIDLAARVAEEIFIPFTVGGGIDRVEIIRDILLAGADKVSLNTAAIRRPELISEAASLFGSQCIVVAVDVRQDGGGWRVTTHGGRRDTGLDALEWIKDAARRGAGEILLTSMDADGTRDGYDLDLTRRASESVGIPLIASGGAGCARHLVEAARIGRADAVLLAGILHDGAASISGLKGELHEAGLSVRRIVSRAADEYQ